MSLPLRYEWQMRQQPGYIPALGNFYIMTSLCVFCGSSPGKDDDYLNAARHLGQLLAEREITLIYGGGSVGLMGAVANATLRAGGRAVGVIPRHLWNKEVGHRGLSDLFIVDSMHERKAKMAEMSDGFIILPGGIGTLEEFFEIWTWCQLGIHSKPFGVLDVNGYWKHLLTFLDVMTGEGFLKPDHRSMVQIARDPAALIESLASSTPPLSDGLLDLARS